MEVVILLTVGVGLKNGDSTQWNGTQRTGVKVMQLRNIRTNRIFSLLSSVETLRRLFRE